MIRLLLFFHFTLVGYSSIGQTKSSIVIGLDLTPIKYYKVKYAQQHLYFPDLGTISIEDQNQGSYQQDLNVFVMKRVREHSVKLTIGLTSDQFIMNSEGESGSVGFRHAVILDQHFLTTGLYYSYRILDKKSLHIFITSGASYYVLNTKNDYNFINRAFGNYFSSKITESLFGKAYLADLSTIYSSPKLKLISGLEVKAQRFIFSLLAEYANKDIGFGSQKPYLISELLQFKLQTSLLIRNRFIK